MPGNPFAPLLDRLAAVPHRSVTGVPYKEWFRLYIHSLQTSAGVGEGPLLSSARVAANAALLRSVMSRRWTEVVPPPPSPASVPSWQKGGTTWAKPAAWNARECVTAAFLADPQLGARRVAAWGEAMRQHTPDGEPPALVVVPFSALYALRHAAHPLAAIKRDGTPSPPSLSLQERHARRAVLHALHHVLGLQSAREGDAVTSRMQLVVWGPLDEFDAIMHAVTLRAEWADSLRHAFTLERLCEDDTARLAYLTHFLTRASGTREWTLLAPPSVHPVFRQLGVRSVSEKSATTAFRTAGDGHSLHRQAADSCGRLVRRLSAREENLRQTLIP